MTEIALKIENQVIQLPEPRPRLVAGSAGVYAVTLDYDAQWDDATVRVVVFDGGLCNSRVSVQDTTGTVTIPAECIAHGGRGNWLQIGVLGYDGTGALRITTRAMLDGLRIDPAGASDADVPQDAPAATPGLWEKLVADVGNLSDLQTADASSLVAAINELAAGVEGAAADAASVGARVAGLDTRLMSIPDIAMSGGTATTYTANSADGTDGVYYTKVADDTPALWELIGGTITPHAVIGGSPPGYKWTITADRYIRLSDNAFGFEVGYAYGYVGVVVATAATMISPVLSDPETTAQIPEAGIYLGTLRREGQIYNYISSLTYSKGQTIDPRFIDTSSGDFFVVNLTQNDDGELATETTWQELQDALSAGKPLCLNAGGSLFTDVSTNDSSVVFSSLSYDGASTIYRVDIMFERGKNGEIVCATNFEHITIPNLDDIAAEFGMGTLRVTITGSGTTADPYASDVTPGVIHTALNAGQYVYAVQVLNDTTCRTFWHVDEAKTSDGSYSQQFKQLSTDGNAIYDLTVRVLNGETDVRITEGASADTEPLLLHWYGSGKLSSTELAQLNAVTGHPNRLVALVYHWRAPGQAVDWRIYMPLVEARSYGTWYFWSKSEGTGTWSAEVSSDGTVTITRQGTDHTLGLTSATVGQIAKITAVDESGAPTAWEAVDIKSDDLATWVNEKIDAKLGVIENGAY